MRIALDTAILVRTNIKDTGPAKELLKTIERSGGVLVLSTFLIRDVERVLKYPRIQRAYRLTDSDIQQHNRVPAIVGRDRRPGGRPTDHTHMP